MRLATLGLAGLGLLVLGGPAMAHHSFAMFDTTRTVALDGTVGDFVWTNPHSWIMILVPNAEGVDEQWAIEMGGPAGLGRAGWSAATLSQGMHINLIIRPHTDGTRFGQFMSITLPDGTQLGNPDAPPGADAGGLPPR